MQVPLTSQEEPYGSQERQSIENFNFYMNDTMGGQSGSPGVAAQSTLGTVGTGQFSVFTAVVDVLTLLHDSQNEMIARFVNRLINNSPSYNS